jgi:hypothetical protein
MESKILLTVFLRHDQSKNLEQILAHAKRTGLYRDFPPEGTELISCTVAMSFGLVFLLRVEADKLRTLNRFMEEKAWGAFRYEVYPSYDLAPVIGQLKKDHATPAQSGDKSR